MSPTNDQELPPAERRPYEAPAVIEDVPMETMSLSCGTMGGKTHGACSPFSETS